MTDLINMDAEEVEVLIHVDIAESLLVLKG